MCINKQTLNDIMVSFYLILKLMTSNRIAIDFFFFAFARLFSIFLFAFSMRRNV